jgi:hypothetical protein
MMKSQRGQMAASFVTCALQPGQFTAGLPSGRAEGRGGGGILLVL